jgi:hypothetical protein
MVDVLWGIGGMIVILTIAVLFSGSSPSSRSSGTSSPR